MFGTRLRKILRDVWARKVRTLLVSSSIFIGVLGVVTLFSAGEILIDQLQEDLQQDELAMIRLSVTSSSQAQANDQAVLDKLRDVPGVAEVEGRYVYRMSWRLPGAEFFEDGTVAAYTEPLDAMDLEPPTVERGAYPQPGEKALAVERRMADRYGLDIGSEIELRILSDSGDNDGAVKTETWTVSGIVFQPYGEVGGTGPLENETLAFAQPQQAQYIAGRTGLSAIYARYNNFATADDDIEQFESNLDNYAIEFRFLEDPAENSAIEQTRSTNRILVLLAMIALVVSGFLVINVINSIVVEQRRQIGVMKSLGGRREDSFIIYTGITVVYGIIGVIPGVLLGIPGGYYAAQGLANQTNTIIDEFAVSPTGIILGIVVGLAVPFLAAMAPVWTGTRVSILDAMTDVGIEATYGQGLLARIIALIPMPITLRQAINNVNRKKWRLALTGTTLTVAVGAFMGIFAVFSSIATEVEETFETIGNQIGISPSQGRPLEDITSLIGTDEFQARLAEEGLPQLRDIEPGASLAITIVGYDPPPISAGPPGLFAFGINPANPDIARLDLREGDGWQEDPTREGVVISSRIADLMAVGAGETINIRARGNEREFEIIGVSNYPFDTVWFRWDDLARLGGLVLGAAQAEDYGMGTTAVNVPGYTSLSAEQPIGLPPGLTGVLGLTPEVSQFFDFVAGENFTPGADEVIISTVLAERGSDECRSTSDDPAACSYAVDDTLTISFRGSEPKEYTIAGIFQLPERAGQRNPVHPTDVIGIFWEELAQLEGRPLPADPAAVTGFGRTPPATVTPQGADQPDGEVETLGLIDQVSPFLNYVEGRTFQPDADEIIISQALAEARGYGVDDRLTLQIDDHAPQTYTVTGVFEFPQQADGDQQTVALYWQDLARLQGRDVDGQPYPNSVDIILGKDDPSVEDVNAVIELIKEELLRNGITAEYINWVEFNETITQFISLFGVILNLAAALIAAVGAVGLLTSLSISVFERQKEIGVMRSVGASSWTVIAQFLVEGLTIGVVAWFFGVPLSILVSQGLINALPFSTLDIGYPPITPLVGLAGMMVVVTIASLWPSIAASRRTVSDILRYQ